VTDAFQEFPKTREVELLTLLHELQKEPLTEWDLMNLRFLIEVTNDLAAYLLQGESAKAWCEQMGLRHQEHVWVLPQKRKLPRPLIITVGLHQYVLSPEGSSRGRRLKP
jgi:hypothetical protein